MTGMGAEEHLLSHRESCWRREDGEGTRPRVDEQHLFTGSTFFILSLELGGTQ